MQPNAKSPKGQKSDPADKKIFVLDDDDEIRQMLKMSLASEGFQVQSARDGRNAAQVAATFQADLIITDVMMPGGGGYEVVRGLQENSNTRDIPVIVMSGYAFDPSTKDLLKQEPNVKMFLEKPVNASTLVRKTHEILNTLSLEERMIERNNDIMKDLPKGDFE